MRQGGFTLIELLVVIAIISVLTAIVLASLNTARSKGQEAAIRSTLKNMSDEIELMRQDTADYSFVNSCASNTQLKPFVTSLQSQGASVSCYSLSFPANADSYIRWGVSAEIVGASPLEAWSASPQGIVKWDTADSPDGTWAAVSAACGAQGKRLPSAEELQSLFAITSSANPPGFVATAYYYWTGTEVPNATTQAYAGGHALTFQPKTLGFYHAHCVSTK